MRTINPKFVYKFGVAPASLPWHLGIASTLVVDVESENSFPGEARKLYDALTCPKTWLYFTEEEGAGDHCQTGSPSLSHQRIMDWLDETVR